jgi:putative nucleotidyltransferase with HDIG domain
MKKSDRRSSNSKLKSPLLPLVVFTWKRLAHWTAGGILIVGLSVVLTLLFSGYPRTHIPLYRPGDIARADVISPVDLTVEDAVSREVLREAARLGVPPVYRFDPGLVDQLSLHLNRLFSVCQSMRASNLAANLSSSSSLLDRSAKVNGRFNSVEPGGSGSSKKWKASQGKAKAEKASADVALRALATELNSLHSGLATPGMLNLLARKRYDAEFARQVEETLRQYQGLYVRDSRILVHRGNWIQVINLRTRREISVPWNQVYSMEMLCDKAAQSLLEKVDIRKENEREALKQFSILLQPNLSPDPALTESRQAQAAGSIGPVLLQLKKGKVVVRQGDEVRAEQMSQLEALRKLSSYAGSRLERAAQVSMIAALLGLFFFFLGRLKEQDQSLSIKYGLPAFLLLVHFFLLKGFWSLLNSLGIQWSFFAGEVGFWALPFAFGGMLMALLKGELTGVLFIIFSGILSLLGWAPSALNSVYLFAAGFFGVLLIRNTQQRIGILSAGIKAALLNASLLLSLWMGWGRGLEQPGLASSLMAAGVSGLICGALIVIVLPVCERLFNVTTDIRLLELSNMNLPALRDLVVKAPGTYNHSITVGLLAEGAAKTVGLNPLFLRVAALYHDLGKIEHPGAFIENQHGRDIHDDLRPEDSVALLREHVLAGGRIAAAARLPAKLSDVIIQHHGSRLIHSFFSKAQKRAGNETEELQDEDFRYPGPKPQTKEAALIMMADTVEAAARASQDHSEEHLWILIQKLVSLMAADGQFSECNITLGELDRISFSFLETLSGIYHHRIDYPGVGLDKRKPARGEKQ